MAANLSTKGADAKPSSVNTSDVKTITDACIGDEYVLVKRSLAASAVASSQDVKSLTPSVTSLGSSTGMSKMSSRAKTHNGRLQKVTVKLCDLGQTVSGSGTWFTSTALSPVGIQDYSAFASVYDIFRVKQIEVKAFLNVSTSVTTTNAQWAYAWDPANPSAYANLSDIFTAENCVGPNVIDSAAATNTPMTAHGTYNLKIRLPTPKEVISNYQSASAQVVAGGGWQACSSSTNPVGYIKAGAITGSGVTGTIYYCLIYTVEFASRT